MLSECFHLGLTGYQGSEEENALIVLKAVGMVQDGFGQIVWKRAKNLKKPRVKPIFKVCDI